MPKTEPGQAPIIGEEREEINRMMEERVRQLTAEFPREFEGRLAESATEDRRRNQLPRSAGLDESKYFHLFDINATADFYQQRRANPHLPSEIHEKIDLIATKSLAAIEQTKTDRIVSRAYDDVEKTLRGQGRTRMADRILEIADPIRQRMDDELTNVADALTLTKYLNGELNFNAIDGKMRERAIAEYEIDPLSRRVIDARKAADSPSQLDFTSEMTGRINRSALVEKYRNPGPKTPLPDAAELEYAHASFGRAFNGLFGINGAPVPQGHPMYLGKFDNIFVNGKSVAQLCKGATQGMNPKAANDYMTLYTTATAIDRKSRIECVPPKVQIRQTENGAIEKSIAPGRQPGSGIIPVVSKVKEITPKPNFFKRAMNKIGLYRIVTAQSEYEKMLANDKDGQIRKADIEGQLTRDDIQRSLLEQKREIRAPHNGADAFFHPDDLAKINPKIADAVAKEQQSRQAKGQPPLSTERINEMYFHNKETGGIATLDRINSRTSIVRLYMRSKGYNTDQVVSADDSNKDIKREIGREFYGILHRGDPEEIGRTYAKMAQTLNNMKIPDIDFTKDSQLVANYKDMYLISNYGIDLSQTFAFRNEENITRERTPREEVFAKTVGEDGMRVFDRTLSSSQTLFKFGVNEKMNFIASDLYSSANRELKSPSAASNPQMQSREGIMSSYVLQGLNEAYSGAKGKSLGRFNLRDLENYASAPNTLCGIKIENAISKDPKVQQQALDYLIGKTEKNPFQDMLNQSLKDNGVQPKPVQVLPEAESQIRISPPAPVRQNKAECISIDMLGEDAGVKTIPKREGRSGVKPQPPNLVRSAPGKK